MPVEEAVGPSREPGPPKTEIRRNHSRKWPVAQVLTAGSRFAGLVPGVVTRVAAETAAMGLAHAPMSGEQRDLVAKHLRRVYGEDLRGVTLTRRINEAYASHGRYWAESLRLSTLSAADIDAGFSYRGIGHIDDARAKGNGAILALPHLGGWEWGGYWLVTTGRPVSVIVENLEDSQAFEWFASWRRRMGMEIIPTGPDAARLALTALRANRVLCLLCDRTVGDTPGIPVEFFGETTLLPSGPVTLAMRSGAPLLPAAVYFGARTDAHLGVVKPPLDLTRRGRFRDDVAAGTQQLASELEGLIRRAPTQWHLFQPNWPSD